MTKILSNQKMRGAYYTPTEIVDFLVDWAIQSKDAIVLEQCFGNGNFLVSSCKKLLIQGVSKKVVGRQLYGSELDKGEFEKAKDRVNEFLHLQADLSNLHIGDFFSHFDKHYNHLKFDTIVGNPPFIRYQHFDEVQRDKAFKIMEGVGLKPNKLTNSWVPFLLSSSLLLKEGGRLGMVIPAEILQVKYAAELRLFLSNYFGAITLITFDKIVFPDIQQEVTLFLGEKTRREYGINLVSLKDERCLENYAHKMPFKETYKQIDHSSDKWTQYFLTSEEISLLRQLKSDKRLTRFGDVAEVDVGIVTGRNEFFLVDKELIKKYRLEKYTHPLVGRTGQIPGLIFTAKDWANSNNKGLKTNLFTINSDANGEISALVKKYISLGESKNFHEGFKCSIRTPWYKVPSIWVSDAFLFRQIYDAPKLILNSAKTLTTDTIHRVKFKNKKDARKIASCFHNSLTFAFSEILGRSYGGGVLELEPNEAENLPIPLFDVEDNLIMELDELYRQSRDWRLVLNKMDNYLLREQLGLSNDEALAFRRIWGKLANRRNNRN